MLSSDKIAIPLLSMFSHRFEEEDSEMCPFFQVELFEWLQHAVFVHGFERFLHT